MKRFLVVFLTLLFAACSYNVDGINKVDNQPVYEFMGYEGPDSTEFKYVDLEEHMAGKPLPKRADRHGWFDYTLQKLQSEGTLVAFNAFRSDASLSEPGVDIRNEETGITDPYYDPVVDGIAIPCIDGYPLVQLRQYFARLNGEQGFWLRHEIRGDAVMFGPQTEPYGTKISRAEDSNYSGEKRLFTSNSGLGPNARFYWRDGRNIFQNNPDGTVNDYGKREVRIRFPSSTSVVLQDDQPGGSTACYRDGNIPPGYPDLPCYRQYGDTWYEVTYHFDLPNKRLVIYVRDMSGLQFNGQTIKVIDYAMSEWVQAGYGIDVFGIWLNSSGRQEGDWEYVDPFFFYTRNLIVSSGEMPLYKPEGENYINPEEF